MTISGKLVTLGALVRSDLALYYLWISDFAVTRYYLDTPRPQTQEERAAAYERLGSGDLHNTDFAISELATMRPIGRVGLEDINYQRRRASFGVLIGEKDCWGKGYGAEAMRLTLEYGFRLLGLYNIMLSALASTLPIRLRNPLVRIKRLDHLTFPGEVNNDFGARRSRNGLRVSGEQVRKHARGRLIRDHV
jgi:hypothetical protein